MTYSQSSAPATASSASRISFSANQKTTQLDASPPVQTSRKYFRPHPAPTYSTPIPSSLPKLEPPPRKDMFIGGNELCEDAGDADWNSKRKSAFGDRFSLFLASTTIVRPPFQFSASSFLWSPTANHDKQELSSPTTSVATSPTAEHFQNDTSTVVNHGPEVWQECSWRGGGQLVLRR